ncbi:hypothetical protein [Burkholderia sola]
MTWPNGGCFACAIHAPRSGRPETETEPVAGRLDGEVADRLAERYQLTLEKGHLPGASSVGYSRRLTVHGPGGALILVSARQGPALKGKTLPACEMTTEEDSEALERMEKHQAARRRPPPCRLRAPSGARPRPLSLQ